MSFRFFRVQTASGPHFKKPLMRLAFLEALPIALGTFLATLPLAGVSLLLASRTRRKAHLSFLGGWMTGALLVGLLAILLSDVSAPGQGPPRLWVVWLRLILGIGLIALAARKWVKASGTGTDEAPGWMRAFETAGASRLYGLGLIIVALNPKNAMLFASGALVIAAKTYVPAKQVLAFSGFVIVASLSVLAPLMLSVLMGERAEAPLTTLKKFAARHSAVILAVVTAVLGAIVIYKALLDLAAY